MTDIVARARREGHLIYIEELCCEIERLRAALRPFAHYYDLNDCKRNDSRLALEVPIDDLFCAKRALMGNKRATERDYGES